MGKEAEIKKAFKALIGANPNFPIAGVVTAVDGQTCSVKLASGLELSDVKLKATVSVSGDYFLLTPAIDSEVLLLSGDGTLSNLYLINIDQVAKFELHQNGLIVEIDSSDNKVKIANGDTSLKDLFTELTAAIRELTVLTADGPSSVPEAATQTALTDFETLFNMLLK